MGFAALAALLPRAAASTTVASGPIETPCGLEKAAVMQAVHGLSMTRLTQISTGELAEAADAALLDDRDILMTGCAVADIEIQSTTWRARVDLRLTGEDVYRTIMVEGDRIGTRPRSAAQVEVRPVPRRHRVR